VPKRRAVTRLDCHAREAALQALLTQYPEAPVAAVNPNGVYVDMPPTVPLTGQKLIAARSSLHFVVPADRKAITDAFHSVVVRGISSVAVHLVNDPERTATLCYFDVRERHGVFVLVLAGYTGEDDVHAVVATEEVIPRFCRTRKSEMSVFLDIDEATTKILGWSREQMVGRRSIDFIHPDDQGRSISGWMEMAAGPGASSRTRLRHLCRNGSWRWLEITNLNALDDPERGCVIAEMADISDEMAALESVRAREQLLERLAEALPLGLFQVDTDRHIVYTNDRLHRIIGKSRATTFDEQMVNVVPEDWPLLVQAVDAVLDDSLDGEVTVRLQPPGPGHQRLCTMSLRALTTQAGEVSGAIVCVADVTESTQMHNELERHAMLDPLTECHNLRSVMSALKITLDAHSEAWPGTAVIFVDVDRFKCVNDTFGHAAGDELLTVVADRLRSTVRADDIVGRIGGDEFLVVCPRMRTAKETMTLARRMAGALKRDVSIASGTLELQVSIGMAWTKAINTDPDTLVGEADAAMYESKRQDLGRPVLFHPSLRNTAGQPTPLSPRTATRGSAGDSEGLLPATG
jgi:diguanylate cyclase (GGDEF)-like protein/PAS domain S-box-containing protein